MWFCLQFANMVFTNLMCYLHFRKKCVGHVVSTIMWGGDLPGTVDLPWNSFGEASQTQAPICFRGTSWTCGKLQRRTSLHVFPWSLSDALVFHQHSGLARHAGALRLVRNSSIWRLSDDLNKFYFHLFSRLFKLNLGWWHQQYVVYSIHVFLGDEWFAQPEIRNAFVGSREHGGLASVLLRPVPRRWVLFGCEEHYQQGLGFADSGFDFSNMSPSCYILLIYIYTFGSIGESTWNMFESLRPSNWANPRWRVSLDWFIVRESETENLAFPHKLTSLDVLVEP